MTYFAGLDVSVRKTAICIVDALGGLVWEGEVATKVDAIAETLNRFAPSLKRAGMETGPVAVWLWHGLRDVNIPLDCIHARRSAAALKLQVNKTDRNDAHGLAQLVRTGWYEPVRMKSILILNYPTALKAGLLPRYRSAILTYSGSTNTQLRIKRWCAGCRPLCPVPYILNR